MTRDPISTDIADGIATITMDAPPLNALTPDMVRALLGALEDAGRDDRVGAVLLSSAVARVFCAGLDLKLLLTLSAAEVRAMLTDLYLNLYDVQSRLGKPSIAVVGGAARGGGVTLAIQCDMIVAADGATFGYPEINLGLPPAIHFAHLPRMIGRNRAFELLFSARVFDAVEAQALGLVNRVMPGAELDAGAREFANLFLSKQRDAVAHARAMSFRQGDLDYRRGIIGAVDDFCAAFAEPAARNGIERFLDRQD